MVNMHTLPYFFWTVNLGDESFKIESNFWPALGYGEQDEIATFQQWLALQAPISRDALRFAVAHCHRSGLPQPASHQIRLADGSHIHVASFCHPGSIRGEANGQDVVGVTLSLALLPSEYQVHMLTAVLGNVGLPIWLEEHDKLLWCSDMFEALRQNTKSNEDVVPALAQGRMPVMAPCNPLVPTQRIGILVDVEDARVAHQELSKSLSEARANSEEQTVFLAAMSHEIRTPTSSILGFIDLLMEDGLTEAQQEFAQIIKKAGEELASIVDSVLDFTRLETGEITPYRRALDLRQLITDACGDAKVRSKRDEVNITVSISSSIPAPFVSDPLIIAKIMTTLIANALRQAEVGIFVRVFRGEAEGRQCVIFAVGDLGNEDDFTKLVAPFSKQNEEACLRRGAGLDLAIVRRLVERLNGRVMTGRGKSGLVLVVELPIELDPEPKLA
jgi:signal transduction histidine kinase